MFNLYLGLTMALYASFQFTSFATNNLIVWPYIKPWIMTPYIPNIEARLALMVLIQLLVFLTITHVVIRLSKVNRLFDTTAPASIVTIVVSIIIAVTPVFHTTWSDGNLRSLIMDIGKTIIVFDLLRLYVFRQIILTNKS